MKNIILVFLCFIPFQLLAGDRVGNGGGISKIRYMAMVNRISDVIKMHQEDFPQIDIQKWTSALKNIRVEYRYAPIMQNGVEMAILGIPKEQKVLVNILLWNTLFQNKLEKYVVILKEYLKFFEITDQSGMISIKLLDHLKKLEANEGNAYYCEAKCSIKKMTWNFGRDQYREKIILHNTSFDFSNTIKLTTTAKNSIEGYHELKASCVILQQNRRQSILHLRTMGSYSVNEVLANPFNSCQKIENKSRSEI